MSEISREQLMTAMIAGRGPAYLRGVNLSFMDLSCAGWLVEADLRNADLSNANLRRATLKGADMERANLHSANLLGANLEGANLFKVKANVANFNLSNLRGVNLTESTLVGANMIRADLEGANLDGADLEGANLQGSNLRKAHITNANLKMVNLEGADLTEAVLDGSAERMGADNPVEERDFHGTITSIKLTDLIQIGCLSRSNLNIEVHSNAGKGNIFIESGRIRHAEAGSLVGEEAFLKILGWDSGRFHTYPYGAGGTVSIDKPVEQLMIQSLRLRDENRSEEGNFDPIRTIEEFIPVEAGTFGEQGTISGKQ